ncbi:MAG: hypothetical protein NZM25_07915 [Leptospiraceae bacterium]|nr:hypothetical protein [Leptospiraceae bacterium]MDW8305526.1 hypothetical protein [Leptospiraceae bacterium]
MPVDAETKKKYNDLIAGQKKEIADLEKEISLLRRQINVNKKLEPFYRLKIISLYLKQANLYLEMSNLSESMMNIKNHSYLDNGARKLVYKILSEGESIVTAEIDEPLDHNREQLDKLKPFNPRQRLNLYKHIKRLIERLIQAYGPNTKWQWSFPELWSKSAVLLKNLIDFREVQAIRDPREEFYYDRQEMLELVKEDLFQASNHYRDKFELSTKSPNDILHAIKLLEALKRIASLMGDTELVKRCKSGIEAYRSRIEADEKEKEKKKAKSK